MDKQSQETINFLYEGLVALYPIQTKSIFGLKGSFPILETWKGMDRSSFATFAFNITDTYDIEDAIKKIKEWKDNPEITRSIPTNINELVSDLDKQKANKFESYQKNKRLLYESQVHQEALQKRKSDTGRLNIYINANKEVPLPTLSDVSAAELNSLMARVKNNPTLFANSLSEEIYQKAVSSGEFDSPSQKASLKINSKIVALDFTDKLVFIADNPIEKLSEIYTTNTIHQTATLSNPNSNNLIISVPDTEIRQQIAESAQNMTATLENDYITSKTLLSSFANDEVLSYFYPTDNNIVMYEVSSTSNNTSFLSLDTNQFIKSGKELNKSNKEILEKIDNNQLESLQENNQQIIKDSLENYQWYTVGDTKLEQLDSPHSFNRYQPTFHSELSSSGSPNYLSGFIKKGGTKTFGILLGAHFSLKIGALRINRMLFRTPLGFAGKAMSLTLGKVGFSYLEVATAQGKRYAFALINTNARVVSKTLVKVGVPKLLGKTGGWLLKIGGKLGSLGGPVAGAIIFLASLILDKILGPIVRWVKKNKEIVLTVALAPLVLVSPTLAIVPIAVGGWFLLGGLAGIVGFLLANLVLLLGTVFGTGLLIAFIIFIINTGAYVVPPSTTTSSLPGGVIAPCPQEAGADITQNIASTIRNGVLRLLPDSNGARQQHICITPTTIILHTSAGYDNDLGNDITYNTLVQRNVACQLSTDTNDTYVMQPFYENQVEMAWCANSGNATGISIEISGECQDSGGSLCSRTASACSPKDDLIFKNPPPHPCAPESDLAFDAVCTVMKQYKIPWNQVYTHDDIPDSTHTDPVGKDWVYEYFIPKLRDECPI